MNRPLAPADSPLTPRWRAALVRFRWMAAQHPPGGFPVRQSDLLTAAKALARRDLMVKVQAGTSGGTTTALWALTPTGDAMAEGLTQAPQGGAWGVT